MLQWKLTNVQLLEDVNYDIIYLIKLNTLILASIFRDAVLKAENVTFCLTNNRKIKLK